MLINKFRQIRLWAWLLALVAMLGIGLTASNALASVPVTDIPAPSPSEAKANSTSPQACGIGSNYTFSTAPLGFQPGVADIGNHCDDCTTGIPMPFAVRLYKQVFSTAFVSSNGNLQFTSNNNTFANTCLMNPNFSNTIFPHWDDMRTDNQPNCAAYGGVGCGIFTQVYGISPNRTFVIEWRAVLFGAGGQPVQFEIILYENQDRFDMAYRLAPNQGAGATSGVQKDTVSGLFTQYSCNTPTLFPGLYLVAFPLPCPTNTPTPQSTRSITVIKINHTTGDPIPNWPMSLYNGPGCLGVPVQSGSTNAVGIIDFTGLAPGSYSVEEATSPGWVPIGSICQDVILSAQPDFAGKSTSVFSQHPDIYPPAGTDTFPSGGHVSIEMFGLGSDDVTLNGPSTVVRSNPCFGCGPGGSDFIDIELLQMDLTGNSSVFGPVHIRESPSRPSLGRLSQQTPGADFPADSFFDVFIELPTTPLGPLHTNDPIRVQTIANGIPPLLDPYISPADDGVVILFNSSEQPVGGIRRVIHVPLPPDEIFITFRNQPPLPTPTNTPTPIRRSITVLKLNSETGQPIPGWKMMLHSGLGCVGPTLGSLFTGPDGTVDFTNLPPGDYSVEELLQAGWTPLSGVCQDVTLSLAGGSGSKTSPSAPSPDYPPAGDDTFPSAAIVTIELMGMGSDTMGLNGPTTVHRDNPCPGCGPGGRTTIDTEMLSMDLIGSSPTMTIRIRESPTLASLGRTTQQTPGMDFPADSFFDVFVEIDSPMGMLHNQQPIQVQAVINEIPPMDTRFEGPAGTTGVPLLNSGGQVVGFLRRITHITQEIIITFRNQPPLPTPTFTPTPIRRSITVLKLNADTGQPIPNWKMVLHDGPGCTGAVLGSLFTGPDGTVDFTNLPPGNYSVEELLQAGWTPLSGVCQDVILSLTGGSGRKTSPSSPDYPPAGDDTFPSAAIVTHELIGLGTDTVGLNGPSTVHRADPCVGCGPGGRTTIDTELVSMQLVGNSPMHGPLRLRESPSRPSLGGTMQQTPGMDFPADSFFDVFVEIDTALGTLHTNQPVHVEAVINEIPPMDARFEGQIPLSGIPLLDASNNTVGFLRRITHITQEIIIVFRNQPPASTFTPTSTPVVFTNTPTNTPTCTPHVPAVIQVNILGFAFVPPNVLVTVGDTVNWTNLDTVPHTSTSDTAVWNSGVLGTGMSYAYTFTTPGVYPYHCTIHPFMVGSVRVLPDPCAPTPTNTPAATFTNTPTVTPTCKPILIGHLTYQGIPQPDSRNLLKAITLTLKMGTLEVNYPLMATDDRGFFTVNVSALPPGNYQWRVKGVKYLANSGTLVLTGGCVTTLEVGIMRAGDVNNDNLVNSIDFALLRNSFGKACGQPGFEPRADFNNDCLVNSIDFTLLRNNFGFGGAPPISPGKQ